MCACAYSCVHARGVFVPREKKSLEIQSPSTLLYEAAVWSTFENVLSLGFRLGFSFSEGLGLGFSLGFSLVCRSHDIENF